MEDENIQILLPAIQVVGTDLRRRKLTPLWQDTLAKARTNWVKQNVSNPNELFDPKKIKTRTSLTDSDWEYIYSKHPEYFDPASKYHKQVPDKYLSRLFNKWITDATSEKAYKSLPFVLGAVDPVLTLSGVLTLTAADEMVNSFSGNKYNTLTDYVSDKTGSKIAGAVIGMLPGMIGTGYAAKATYTPSYTTNARIIERDPSLVKESILDVNKNITNKPKSSVNLSSQNLKHSIQYLEPATHLSGKTYLGFLERPASKLTLREKFGLPKGTKIYTLEENIAFRNELKDFVKKYNYDINVDNIPDEQLERVAKDIINLHNSYVRGVKIPEKGTENYQKLISKFGPNPSHEQIMREITVGSPHGNWISASTDLSGTYGEVLHVQRPYTLGPDRMKWFKEGDFDIYGITPERLDLFVGTNETATSLAPKGSIVSGWEYLPKNPKQGVSESSEFIGKNLIWRGPISERFKSSHNRTVTTNLKCGGKLNYLNYVDRSI